MSNPDPNHVKGSHPHAAAHAAKGIRYAVIADSDLHPTREEAHANGVPGGTLVHTVGAHEPAADTEAPAAA